MIQDKVKAQLETLKEQSEKLQSSVNKQLESAKEEGIRILSEMGAEVDQDNVNLGEVVEQLRESNPTIKQFVRNLDVATYDNRFRASWNANMGAAYAKLQANKTFSKEVEPRIQEVRDNLRTNISDVRGNVETRLRDIQDKAKELRSKIAS